MFDELYYNEENSLDLLLKFSTESENPQEPSEYQFEPAAKQLPPTDSNIVSLIDLLAVPCQPEPAPVPNGLAELQAAAQQQENKLQILLANKNKVTPKLALSVKRKVSECTEAPNSPLRKTKAVRKEKS